MAGVREFKGDRLIGILVRSAESSALVESITFPESDEGFVAVTAEDLGEANIVDVAGSAVPIFPSREVRYEGQPVAAVFSQDAETSQLLARDVKVEYEKTEPRTDDLPPRIIKWGNVERFLDDQTLKKVSGVYYFGQQCAEKDEILRVRAAILSSGKVVVECPTQWPFHVKRTVARALGVAPESVEVRITGCESPKDKHLAIPSLIAAATAVAAKKGGCPAEIITNCPVCKPEIVVNRVSVVDKDGNLLAEDIEASADMGAYPMFAQEMANHMICGLVPIYPVENMRLRITLYSTNKTPSSFYGTLGFPDCLATSEIHISKIASEMGVSPLDWRLAHLAPSRQRSRLIMSGDLALLRQSILETAEASDFQRKHFSFEHLRAKKNKLNSLLSYARGIGLACAPGINGFSTRFRDLSDYSIKLTIDSDGKLVVNTSFPPRSNTNPIWTSFVSRRLKIPPDDISFEAASSPALADSGPDVLSRNLGNVLAMLDEACEDISARRFKEPLPLEARVSSRRSVAKPLFTSRVWAVVALELEIDPVTIAPVVQKCWVVTNFEMIHNRATLEAKMKRVIESTITELGGRPDRDMEDFIVFHSLDEGRTGSVTQALSGALAAAFSSALCQAVNVDHVKLPVSSEYLFEVIGGQS